MIMCGMLCMQALSGKQTLFSLQEMLSEAASKGADDTPLADTLRKRIEVAEKWEERAARFLADADHKKQQLETLEVRHGLACSLMFTAWYFCVCL